MGKTIVLITGSPRKGGNSAKMADAFTQAAESKGHTVQRIDAAFMNVKGCMACNRCYSNGKPCAVDNGFTEIGEKLEKADAIVFCTPVYWYTFPAQIKAVFDKIYSLAVGQRGGEKECGLIGCCEEHDITVLDGLRIPYERSISLMKWKNMGEVLVPGVLNIGDIDNTDGCAQATALAEKF